MNINHSSSMNNEKNSLRTVTTMVEYLFGMKKNIAKNKSSLLSTFGKKVVLFLKKQPPITMEKLTKNQKFIQSGTAMLAQANQKSQFVLRFFR